MATNFFIAGAVATLALINAGAGAAFAEETKSITKAQVEKLLKTAPGAYDTHMTAAKFYEQEGSVGQAQSEYRLAIACKNVQPEAYKMLAQALLKSTDMTEAEKISREGVKLFPRDYGMLLTCGYVLHNEKKLPEAMTFYQRARDIQPKNPQIYVAMADLTASSGKPDDALKFIDQAIALGLPSDLVLYEQGKILASLGRFDQAATSLAQAFKLNPLTIRTNTLYLSVLKNLHRNKEALLVQLMIMAPANDKDIGKAKMSSGQIMLSLSQPDTNDAIARADSLLKDIKTKGRLHFALGDIYDKLNRRPLAIEQYQKGLALDPSLARGYLRLGEDQEAFQKNLPEALKNYEKAFSMDKNDPEIKLRLNLIKMKMNKH